MSCLQQVLVSTWSVTPVLLCAGAAGGATAVLHPADVSGTRADVADLSHAPERAEGSASAGNTHFTAALLHLHHLQLSSPKLPCKSVIRLVASGGGASNGCIPATCSNECPTPCPCNSMHLHTLQALAEAHVLCFFYLLMLVCCCRSSRLSLTACCCSCWWPGCPLAARH